MQKSFCFAPLRTQKRCKSEKKSHEKPIYIYTNWIFVGKSFCFAPLRTQNRKNSILVNAPETRGFRGRSAGEVRASNKMPAEVCRNRKKVQPLSGQVFPLLRDRRTGKRKLPTVNFWNAHRERNGQEKSLSLLFALLHDWNCPPTIPAGYSVAMRKDALLIFSRHVSLCFTVPLRSVLGRGFVLFRSGGKTSIQCATPALLKEKECI